MSDEALKSVLSESLKDIRVNVTRLEANILDDDFDRSLVRLEQIVNVINDIRPNLIVLRDSKL